MSACRSGFGSHRGCIRPCDSGYVKGYALVEYAAQKEAKAAIEALNGDELLTQVINVTWAFSQGPINKSRAAPRGRR